MDVTTLADNAKRYINGIKDYGDLDFKFLYDNASEGANYRIVKGLETAEPLWIGKSVCRMEPLFAFRLSDGEAG